MIDRGHYYSAFYSVSGRLLSIATLNNTRMIVLYLFVIQHTPLLL